MAKFRIETHNGKTRVWDLETGHEVKNIFRLEYAYSPDIGPPELFLTLYEEGSQISGEVEGEPRHHKLAKTSGGISLPIDADCHLVMKSCQTYNVAGVGAASHSQYTCSWCEKTFSGDSLNGFCLDCHNAGHAQPEPSKIKFREFT